MKLSKRFFLIIGIGIFIIALAGLGVVCFQRVSEKNQLNEQLASVQLRLSTVQLEQLSSQQAELEEQLSQATSQFEAVKAMLSQPVGSIGDTSILFAIAEACGVEVTEMTSSSPATESLEGVTCSVISLTAKVEGKVPNLVGFITRLNSYFTTGVVRSVTITVLEAASSDNTSTVLETTSSDNASANIQLAIYTHQGD